MKKTILSIILSLMIIQSLNEYVVYAQQNINENSINYSEIIEKQKQNEEIKQLKRKINKQEKQISYLKEKIEPNDNCRNEKSAKFYIVGILIMATVAFGLAALIL